ncbi:MFS transporter [Alicyclobacillus kakegawensis]|uniref:MFS transporter n=1 Tax=Alicyclobacillus kakegawensis TaxID=392012 RepID=UPI00082E917A|nr:MFS transporter [Alicyclobacillus kakegawensis]
MNEIVPSFYQHPVRLTGRLDHSAMTPRHVGLYVIVILGHMFDGFGISMIGYILASITMTFSLHPSQSGFLASSGSIGMAVGAFIIGPLTDKIGRKRGFMLAIGIFATFSVLCAVSHTYSDLVWFRAIQGVGLGMYIPITGTYVSEFMPVKQRGRALTLSTFFWSGATLLAGGVGAVLVPNFGWRSMFIAAAVPAFVVFVLWFFMPESVRYLIKRGKLEVAERIVDRLSTVSKENFEATSEGDAGPVDEAVKHLPVARIFSGKYARLTSGVWIMEVISGIVLYGLSTWLPSIFEHMGFGMVHSFLFSAVITGSGAIGSFIGALLIEQVGYRRLLVIGFTVGGILLIVWSVATSPIIIVIVGAFSALFGVGAGGVVFAYLSSLYPTAVRATGVAWGGLWQRVGGIIAPSAIGILIGLHVPNFAFFIVLGILWLIGGLVSLVMTRELAGKSLEQIDQELAM